MDSRLHHGLLQCDSLSLSSVCLLGSHHLSLDSGSMRRMHWIGSGHLLDGELLLVERLHVEVIVLAVQLFSRENVRAWADGR